MFIYSLHKILVFVCPIKVKKQTNLLCVSAKQSQTKEAFCDLENLWVRESSSGYEGTEHSSVINGGTHGDRVAQLRRSRGSGGTQIQMNSSWLGKTVKWLCKRPVTGDELHCPCTAQGYFQGEDWEGGERKEDQKMLWGVSRHLFFKINNWEEEDIRKQKAKSTCILLHCFLFSTPER